MQLLLQLSFLGTPEAVAQCRTAGLIVLCTLLGFIRYIFHVHKIIFNKTCLPCSQSASALVQCSHTGFFGFFGACLLDGLMQYKVCGNSQDICGSYVKITPPAFFNV